MHWRLAHTTVLPCTLQQAHDLCINLDNFIPMQELVCKEIKIQQRGDESKIPKIDATRESILKMLESEELPDLPWSSLNSPSTEPHATYFEMTDSGLQIAKVFGSQYALENLHVVLWHSLAKFASIEQWKLRLVYEDADGKVKVSETVWGSVGIFWGKALLTFDIPRKLLAKHMDSYHTLLPSSAKTGA